MQRLPMSDQTTPGPDLREQIATVFAHRNSDGSSSLNCYDPTHQRDLGLADAILAVVQPEIDRRDAEIERLYDLTSRLRADYRAEIAEAETQIRTADAEIERLRALWAAVAKTSRERKAEADGRRKYAEKLEAAIARVREIHPRESDGFHDVCGICFNEHEDSATWPCPTMAALERSDLPTVRAFAAEHDPRGEPT